jgi:folate-binding protein YgfZ
MDETGVEKPNHGLLVRHTRSGLLHISGDDHRNWLQGVITADILNIAKRGLWGLFLDRTGRVRGEVIGILEEKGLWLAVVGGEIADVHRYLDSLIVMEDVTLAIDPSRSLWAVHCRTESLALPREDPENGVCTGTVTWVGTDDLIFEVADSIESEWLAQMRALGLQPSGDEAWEQCRVAAGLPKWGTDYTSKDTPHHAGLFGRAVARNKGCYIGQEVVCKVEMLGHVSQRVTRIALDSLAGLSIGAQVVDKQTGESAGLITSVAPSLIRGKAWAIARVKSTLADKGGEVVVGSVQGRISE